MAGDGPALVLAGAGSGKTMTITYRMARLVEKGTQPEEILLLTFTNMAAKEMINRASSILQKEISSEFNGTFHHFSSVLLKKEGQRTGIRNFKIIDREDSVNLVTNCIKSWKKYGDNDLPRAGVFMEVFSYTRNRAINLGDAIKAKFPHLWKYGEAMNEIYLLYTKEKEKLGLLDFEDLLEKAVELLLTFPDIRKKYGERFKYILVDEYQDTNRVQTELLDLLCEENKNIMVVGDDCQSIYSFRGADYRNILEFPVKYRGAAIYRLRYNYRSTPPIIKFANSILTNANTLVKKEMIPVIKGGNLPLIVKTRDTLHQANFVATEIKNLLSEGISPREIAVLYRNHSNSSELQLVLSEKKIPYEVRSGIGFQERAHIKDILSFLRIVEDPTDFVAFSRILKMLPGVGKGYAQRFLEEINKKGDPLSAFRSLSSSLPKQVKDSIGDFLDVYLLAREVSATGVVEVMDVFLKNWFIEYMEKEYTDFIPRLEEIYELKRISERYSSIKEFVERITLAWETAEGKKEGIVLSTIHQAKGLEWENLFLIWAVENVIPSRFSIRSAEEIEEERRLFYVAITRAKKRLYIVYPSAVYRTGRMEELEPSRFLKELPRDVYRALSPP